MHSQRSGLNAAEHLEYLKARRATAPAGSLRQSMYSREGVEETDFQIGRGLSAWAIERWTGPSAYRHRQTTIVFGTCRSDALRRASAPGRLGEEFHDDVTSARRITSGWDDPVAWPAFEEAS